jgi:hypothetical protein
MDRSNISPKKGLMARIAELGPAWITAITGLIAVLVAAGFFAGRSTGSPGAQPTKTITVTETPSATRSQASPSSDSPTGTQSPIPNGTLLGSYTFTLPGYGSAPLGTTAPTQAQILAGTGKDVIWNTGAGGAPLQTGGGDQMLSLSNGATPTYQTCKNDTITSDEESYNVGTTYCLIETTGKMAAVSVVSSDATQPPLSIVLHVLVWQNSP